MTPPLLGKETRTYDVSFVSGQPEQACSTYRGNPVLGVRLVLDHDAGSAELTVETWAGTATVGWEPTSGLLTIPSSLFMLSTNQGPTALRLAGSWALTPTELSGSGTFSNQTCQDEIRNVTGVIRSQP